MYPNARVDANGGGDWKLKLPTSFKQESIPSGANGFTKLSDGSIMFTKDGVELSNQRYKDDGSVWTAAADGTKATDGDGNAAGGKKTTTTTDKQNSIFSGTTTTSSSTPGYSMTNFNTNVSFDANQFMKAANEMNLVVQLGSMIPFGLGSFFTQGAMMNVLQKMANAFGFGVQSQTTSVEGTRTTETETKTEVKTDVKTETVAVPEGYKKTTVDGVFEKDGKYVKYGDDKKTLVECDKDGKVAEKPVEKPADKPAEKPADKKVDEPTKKEPEKAEDKKDVKKEDKPVDNGGYNVSKHSKNVFWKNINGKTHYYIEKDGKKVEVQNYHGKTYTLNGKTYDVNGKEVTAKPAEKKKDTPVAATTTTTVKKDDKKPAEAAKPAEDPYVKKGYTKENRGTCLYTKGGVWYAKLNGKLFEADVVYDDGGFRLKGGSSYDKNGKWKGKFKSGSTAGTYVSSNGRSAVSTPGCVYTSKTAIVKTATTREGVDTDAQFQINGGKYILSIGSHDLDYYDITGDSASLAFVDKSTGYMNPNARIFNKRQQPDAVKLKGDGEFKNCTLETIQTDSGVFRLCVKKGGVYYDFNELMATGNKVQVRAGTFISQG